MMMMMIMTTTTMIILFLFIYVLVFNSAMTSYKKQHDINTTNFTYRHTQTQKSDITINKILDL